MVKLMITSLFAEAAIYPKKYPQSYPQSVD